MSDPPPQPRKTIEVSESQVGVIGDHAQVDEIHFHASPSPLAALLGRKGRMVTLTAAQQRRNRDNLLANIKSTWIDDYLHNAVHHAVYMQLGLEYKRDAVSRPWDLTLQPSNQPIPHDRPIGAVFKERGRSLLILGNPASGKTITMLQLAEELLIEAQQDESCPIPVILNLSSWAREQQPLADWLVQELWDVYQVGGPLASAWLESDQLVLLLDGLDEVDETHRDDCIAAINDFKAGHATDIVVCSRIADYERLSNRLNLSIAIRIQPLTPVQVDAYLDRFELESLRAALQADKELQELAKSPLMLSLMSLTYGDQQRIPTFSSLDETRRSLFVAYVRRVFQDRPLPPDSPYDQPQALRWLTNLAHGMALDRQSVFHIERLQPTWLSTDRARRRYRWSVRLIGGLSTGLISGLIVGLIVGLVSGLSFGLSVGLSFGLSVGLFGGLFVGLSENIALSEELRWSPPGTRTLLKEVRGRLIVGLIFGLLGGLTVGLIYELLGGQPGGLLGGLIFGLIVGLLGGLVGGLNACIQTSQTQQQTRPNQGIHGSLRNALRMGFLYGLIGGLSGGLSGGLMFGLSGRLMFGLSGGLTLGLSGGLIIGLLEYGGEAVTQHYTLRLLLARRGILPFPFRDRRLVAYLDAMADRILLRRVGGGWVFIHRYLLEYFASLHPEYETESES